MLHSWLETYHGKRGTTYAVRWREGGIKKGATFQNEATARDFINRLAHGLPIPDTRSFSARAEAYLSDAATYKKPSTVEHFDRPALKLFTKFAGNIPPAAITPETVANFKQYLLQAAHRRGKGYSLTTVRMYMRCLRTALNYMGVTDNPVKSNRLPRPEDVGRVVTPGELTKLVNALPPDVARAVLFTYYTGVRIGELVNLEISDVKKVGENVSAKLRGKTGERTILLHPLAAKQIQAKDGQRWAFPSKRSRLQNCLKAATVKLKMGRVRFHDLRHSFATRYMEQTGDIFGLMNYCGWKSLASVKTYQHITKTRDQAILKIKFARK